MYTRTLAGQTTTSGDQRGPRLTATRVILCSLLACATACDSTLAINDAGIDTAAADAAMTDAADGMATTVQTAISVSGVTAFAALSGTFTKVPYSVEDYDDRGEFDPSTGRFTAMTSGDYQICASLRVPNIAFELDLFKNGVRDRAFAIGNGTAGGCRSVRLVAGDFVEVFMLHNAGSAAASAADAFWDWLTVQRQDSSIEATTSTRFTALSGIFTTIPYDTVVRDDQMQFDAAQRRFTSTTAGDFEFCASVLMGAPAEIDLYINGARENGIGFGAPGTTGCRTLRLAPNDSVDVRMHHINGDPLSVAATAAWNWLTVQPRPLSLSVDGMAPFSAPSGAFTRVPYSGELFDDVGQFDIGSSVFTAATPGDYRVCAMVDDRNPTPSEIDIFKNGTREKALGAGNGPVGGCRVLRLLAGDQIDIRLHQATGATLSLASDGIWPWLEIAKVR